MKRFGMGRPRSSRLPGARCTDSSSSRRMGCGMSSAAMTPCSMCARGEGKESKLAALIGKASQWRSRTKPSFVAVRIISACALLTSKTEDAACSLELNSSAVLFADLDLTSVG